MPRDRDPLENVLGMAAADDRFARRLVEQRHRFLERVGPPAGKVDPALLAAVDDHRLWTMIRRVRRALPGESRRSFLRMAPITHHPSPHHPSRNTAPQGSVRHHRRGGRARAARPAERGDAHSEDPLRSAGGEARRRGEGRTGHVTPRCRGEQGFELCHKIDGVYGVGAMT